jgi:hypothetical protein
MIGSSAAELFIIVIIFATIGGPLWGVIDAARRSDQIFRAAGQNKTLWIALQVLFAPLGTIFYVVRALPALKRESAKAEAATKGPVWY